MNLPINRKLYNYYKTTFTPTISNDKVSLKWWFYGVGLLNWFALIISITSLFVDVTFFENGWIVFLFPYIIFLFLLINALPLIGHVLILTIKRLSNLKTDYIISLSRIFKISIYTTISILILLFATKNIMINLN